MKRLFWFSVLPGVCAVCASLAHAQTPANSESTIQALLAEVRQLRLTLERSAVLAPKIQVSLQRIQLQQDYVSRLSRQLEDVRDQMARAASEDAKITGELKQVEERLGQEQDPVRRKTMEEELKFGKARMEQEREQRNAQAAQQRAREIELDSRVRTEQSKLDELNGRLNDLERMLEPPATGNR